MSTTATFTSLAMAEWMKIFPRQVTETYTSSVKFMKQLTVVAISTITYLRNIFPEDSYTVESFGGIRLRILKKKCRNELAQFLTIAMTQAFEAFDKKYLHKMVICLYDGDYRAENLAEYHMFEYTYTCEGISMNIESDVRGKSKHSVRYSFDNIKEKTVQLIRACVVIMQACHHELPDSYDICVRLYYNEDAPKDYQAPGFVRVEDGEEDHLVSTLSESIKLGVVETPFHQLTNRTYIKETIASSHEVNPTQNPPEFEVTPEENEFDSSSTHGHGSEWNDTRVQCACNLSDDDANGHLLITCIYCNTHQHAACYGLYREDAERLKEHCCTVCSDADPSRKPTDQRIASLNGQQRQCLSVFRRALVLGAAARDVSGRELARRLQLAPRCVTRLLRLLHSHGVVGGGDDHDLVTPRRIFPELLRSTMSKFFHDESSIVEKMIEESLSQENRYDPLGEILSPLERVNLRAAATTSELVEPKPKVVVENEYLREYLNVVAETEKENGIPLSGTHNPIRVDNVGVISRKKKLDEPIRVGIRVKRSKNNKL